MLFYNDGSKVYSAALTVGKGCGALLIGLIIGVVSGVVQFLMLAKFTQSVTGGAFDKKTVFLAVFQFFLPAIVLLGCAWLLRDSLLWAGIGMTASLIACALVRHFLTKTSG